MQDDPLIGQILHGNLLIKALIGEGGMGRVYLACNVEMTEKRYAVKVLKHGLTHNANFRQHFYDEARHQAQLDHPNIVQMIDYFHIDDDYYLVQEYVDGQSLSELIESKGPGALPEKQALSIAKGMLAGLDCAHRLAIVHRDVKSSNVLVDRSGRARLTDFGIAVQAGGSAARREERVIGTPAYMSPEQLRNSVDVDHRSDVYSAGVVLYEALTGKLPFGGDTFETVAAQQLAHPAPNPRNFNPKIRKRVADVVRRALRNDPAERFQGCAQFLKTIEKLDSDAWKYMLVSACVLVAVSIYLVKAMILDKPAIYNVVVSATRNYNAMCREAQNRDRNSNGLEVAASEAESEMVDVFKKHIRDNDRTMANIAQDYGQVIAHLAQFNQRAVRQVLADTEPDLQSAQVWPQTRADYETYRATGKLPTPQEMHYRCGAIGWSEH